ncbi:MAG: biotin/lipoyl-containing protein [Desulforhopalus sp.]
MVNELDLNALTEKYKSDPFSYVDIVAIHTGEVSFKVIEGQEVKPVSGKWQHIPGTELYEINRERNPKIITSRTDGIVSYVNVEVEGRFVEAGEKLLTIKHPLKKREVIEEILKDELTILAAPETANYYFAMDVQQRIEKNGSRSVRVKDGDEILTMSLMKRERPVYYRGEDGIIHSIFFEPGTSVEHGEPLVGICTPEELMLIDKIITRIKADWDSAG